MKANHQNLIPQHFLSRLLGKLADAQLGFITRWAIKKFIAHYHVNLSEAAVSDYREFKTFNDFFTRALKTGARSICKDENAVISPVDGTISEIGLIQQGQLLQAKGAYFNVLQLCGGDCQLQKTFENGTFLTIYLSPKDYHRFHMPVSGKLLNMIYVPGKLYSVNPASVNSVPGLFAKNERVICIFETAIGKMAVIAVGAMIVGSIAMQWHGIVAPGSHRDIQVWDYQNKVIELQQGDEIGHFRLGSTIILLFEQDALQWLGTLQAGEKLRLGNVIAQQAASRQRDH